ncbi:peptidase S49 family [Methanobrevibacter ruminantium M1]|uniref:Peptidase S49 family n=1 Tax=Methanobrevibacter ruminantium (strain ATCC 35063 / DSM 1093 / JCM 13430 / OCM 146 / M1) TaxID=634498 RepID=D3DYX7_METRM|nr:S49 family peptidase [Methanobrevibacter ruminantium]ADC47527.1 peptidase S49 family [Methanobrevibacter ruminantium M1]
MSENNRTLITIGIGAFIIIAILLLIALVLPFSNLAVDNDEIAVITISDTITYGDNSTSAHTSKKEIESELNDAYSNPKIKGIVLDIDSGGGSLVASDEISDLIKKSPKPIVSYIGDKGFDEAYQIASATDYIFASSSSSLGGIGLSYINTDRYSDEKVTGVFNEKYLKNNKTKSNSKVKSANDLANAQKMVDQDYTLFIKKIAENRNLTADYVAELAHGKKYNGNEAKKLGLIDEIGSKSQSIEKAAKLSNATNYTVITYPEPQKKLTEILGENDIFNLKELIKI